MPPIMIIFGSKSDRDIYDKVIHTLRDKVQHELQIASAHRNPKLVEDIAKEPSDVFITGAGLSAALPGVVASKTIKPVIGVPVKSNYMGLDALLSIAQMPPGIPVLAVGVDKAEIAAENALKMLKPYEKITLIGDQNNAALRKATAILDEFQVPYDFADKPNSTTVNLEFVYFDEPVEKKDELIIYIPLLLTDDDKAEAAINLLKHSTHGLWVGLNRGENAALAAIEILNLSGAYTNKLIEYRQNLMKK
ncbi:MAG: AIR carboxylase family protein [Candidatus Woesearchaeota archaeon]|jgi:5-(carboxyamino)imidazole ribonucleotide mutase|nr:AIR carboxylase family protein [Candidatus Woesearchaeota archaeon]